ncbi:zinc knuckle CCHC-type [Artemisia annua]|uniref:Zinc knuckle CCHC-type n=1 Tax=Artemisia annua TaxID=35608 RepID=A0A2U1LHC0_ARTAN|nr:zinc knuckle CCHC-type [Artemisia annua]
MESDHQNLLHLQLEQTVIKILKSSNLDTATELSVRNDAQKLLGVDLSDLASKQLVRRTVESYLLSTSPENEDTEAVEEVPVNYDGGGRIICRLPGMSRVSVKNSEGSKLVSIRKYYDKMGKVFPLGQGITLNPKEWSAFQSSFPDIEEAITKIESRMREEKGIGRKQTETEASNPSTSMAPQPRVRERLQTEAETSVFPPQPLIPIATTRFTGKNYYCWKRQMEFCLNQLRISSVLIIPCPKIPVSPHASFEEITHEEDYRSQQKRENGLKKDPKRLCFGCHKEGHIQRDCPLRRSYRRDG